MQTEMSYEGLGHTKVDKLWTYTQPIFEVHPYCRRCIFKPLFEMIEKANLSPINAEIPSVSWYFISDLGRNKHKYRNRASLKNMEKHKIKWTEYFTNIIK
jgi:hypothetical protein